MTEPEILGRSDAGGTESRITFKAKKSALFEIPKRGGTCGTAALGDHKWPPIASVEQLPVCSFFGAIRSPLSRFIVIGEAAARSRQYLPPSRFNWISGWLWVELSLFHEGWIAIGSDDRWRQGGHPSPSLRVGRLYRQLLCKTSEMCGLDFRRARVAPVRGLFLARANPCGQIEPATVRCSNLPNRC